MIEYLKSKASNEDVFKVINSVVGNWFKNKFKGFSDPQKYAIIPIHNKENILVSAVTGSGKCITSDSTIILNVKGQARLITGYELIKLAKSGRLIEKIDKSGRLYEVPNVKCYSLNKGKIKKQPTLIYFEYYKGKIYIIKTEYGREINLSPEHPLLVETEKGEKWIPVKDIKKNQRIGVPIKVELPEKDIKLNYKEAIKNIRKKASITVTYSDFKRLKRKTRNFTDFEILNVKELYEIKTLLQTSFSKLKTELNVSIATVFKILNRKRSKNKERLWRLLRKKCGNIRFKENQIIVKNHGINTHSFTYPKKVDIKLARWIAFVLAEGLIGDYENGTSLMVSQKNRTNLLNEFFRNTKLIFDMEFSKKNYKDYTIDSTLFCYFLNDLLDLKRGRGRKIPIPDWVLNAKKSIKSNFLYIFFSLESNIPKSGNEIDLVQSNRNKIETINYMLSSFGIISSIGEKIRYAANTKKKTRRNYFTLTIRQIRNIKLFLRHIKIDHPNEYLLRKQISKKSGGECILKHRLDYGEIKKLRSLYRSYKSYKKDLGNIKTVILRRGYLTENALKKIRKKLLKFKDKSIAKKLIKKIDDLLKNNICWLKIKEIKIQNYKGKLIDLTVPDVHNFIGGYGGIYLHNTLTAFTSILSELITFSENDLLENQIYAVYISPLKALSNDVEFNLNQPLKEMESESKKDFNIKVAVRTGDTTQSEKSKMLRKTPHILITTPESFSIVLTSPKLKEKLRSVKWVIIDEIHALAESKRGVHLSLALERLEDLSQNFTRIGLSATAEPIEDIARFLVGSKRKCKIAKVELKKNMDIKVLSPVPDLINVTHKQMHNEMYDLIDNLIQEHKTTLVFTNTRSATERVVHHLKERFPKKYTENIGAHHGSLSKEHRLDMETRMREGKLKAIVCSTSLELGIDIGYIDLVILLGSPKSVARCTQRFGRAGHRLHDTIKGRIIVLDRDDLVECSILLKDVIEGKIDRIHLPENCLDVLAQQIYGIAITGKISEKDLWKMVTGSYCYRNLKYSQFIEVLDYLSGEYTKLEDRYVYAKIWYDKETGMIGKRSRLARMIYMTNVGTIPDETHVQVKVGEQTIGKIDEAFLERLKRGDVFVLGGSKYEFLFSRGMTAQVKTAEQRPPTIPSWFSEMLPLSFDLAQDISKFRGLMEKKFNHNEPKEKIMEFIDKYLYVDSNAASAIYEYLKQQYLFKELPNDKKILIEEYKEDSKNFIVFHSLYGRRVNDVLSRAVAYIIGRLYHMDVEIGINDNGFYVASERSIITSQVFDHLKVKDIDAIMKNAIDKTEVLKRRFRHCIFHNCIN